MRAGTMQLKITLLDVEPLVWRRVVVPTTIALDELHTVVQMAMGWLDYHLHLFEIDGVVYADDADEMEFEVVGDEADTILAEVVGPGSRFRYEYDFSDGWQHQVEVEQVSLGLTPTRCVDGERACPPEDCGGPPGYARLLRALADLARGECIELIDRYGDFDPDDFDADAVTEQLAQ